MEAVLVALGVVFLAELGDKSQLIALTFATRGRPFAVLGGVAVACAILQAIAVGVGAAVSEALPERAIEIAGGVAFLVFAVLALRSDDDDDDDVDASKVPRTARAIAIAAGSAFFIAELGDKTQLATLTLASTNGALPTWLGAVVGEVAADALAVLIGAKVGARLPTHVLRYVSAAAFAVFGVLLLLDLG
jgi:putative Ca2+/H+ antiporter (TMEM165/GDT1 family)